jgi:hypothetical protein
VSSFIVLEDMYAPGGASIAQAMISGREGSLSAASGAARHDSWAGNVRPS